MAHIHSVYDTDQHYSINPKTRVLANKSESKLVLVQYDHNSERITFELPRLIDGHDMSQCNVVRVHFCNVDSATKKAHKGVYEVTDLQLSPEDENIVICSWLISRDATQLVGVLSFVLEFSCVVDDVAEYAWHTAVSTCLTVSTGMANNGLPEVGGSGTGGTAGVSIKRIYQSTTALDDGGENILVVELTDGTVERFFVRNGNKGSNGYTPIVGVDYYTEADKAEFSQYIASELAKRGQLTPEFANDVSECTDTSKLYVLPDGYLWAYMTKEITTPGGMTPNFTNLLNDASAVVRPNYRYSASSATWKDYTGTSYIVPIPTGEVTIRVKNFYASGYVYMYASADGVTFRDVGVTFTDVNGGTNPVNTVGVATYNNTSDSFVTFCCASGYVEIVTANEEITYTETEGGTEYVTDWANTGHAFVPADYEGRVIDVENGLADAENAIEALQEKFGNISSSANLTTAFSSPAYCPTPQLPADGSEGSDFNCNTVTTQDAYDYMDALCGKYTSYIHKQTMGKDASGEFDHNRYILSKAYWRAWQKENYPRLFAWQNGSTVIYSVSVSPRVGDSMYTTPYIGTVYSTVTAVNSAAQTASTRTVNGLVFTRYTDGDIEPTVVFTKIPVGPTIYHIEKVYDSAFSQVTTIDTLGDDHFVGADGVTYTRYPFEDRRLDKSKPLSVFILANEHGLLGDSLSPSFAVMRMAKDLCRNTENPFLRWLKENCMITMIPVGNPWGYARYLEKASGYCNSNGVNINRNYDTPGWSTSDTNYGDVDTFGAYPGSEAETQHIMDTIQLCKAAVGMSMHGLGVDPSSEMAQQPDNGYFIHQGCGYDPTRVDKIAEALYSAYNLGMDSDTAQSNSAQNCGKSPAYIQYAGAVGGLTETICWEAGTANNYNAMAMEQAYSQLLMFLQNWCEEALLKASK